MSCPSTRELSDLLDGRLLDIELQSHIESCETCQIALEQLSDDAELRGWWSGGDSHRRVEPVKAGVNADCQRVMQRVLQHDTSIDSPSKQATLPIADEDDYLSDLTPSPFEGDLGLLGIFRLVEKVGEGGMAYVFKGIDTHLNRNVAIKIVRPDRREALSRDRLILEAKSIAGIRHPHVVSIFGVDRTPGGNPFIAMEYMDGGCLQDRIRNHGSIPPRLAALWISQIADGLHAAHQMGLVHRDIKPSNLLLSGSSDPTEKQTIKLADFGLARAFDVPSQVTQTGVLVGTPSYMSPEHIHDPQSVDARSDIYSLGVTLYKALTGEVPYRGAVLAVLQQSERGEPIAPRSLDPSIPIDLETICFKAMHREPSKRYLTAQELSEDLHRFLDGKPIIARPTSSLERIVRWCRRNPVASTLTGIIAGLMVLLTVGATVSALSIYASQKKLKLQNDQIRSANQLAQQAAADAQAQRAIAIESLNGLVTKVQSTLATRPGTIRLREEILGTALEGLNKITQTSDVDAVDRTMIEAHLRKGEILDLLGQAENASREFQTASELAEKALSKSPTDAAAKSEFANVLMAQADAWRRAFAHNQALPIFERAREIREDLALHRLEDPALQHDLNVVLQKIADAYYNLNDFSTAKKAYDDLLPRVKIAHERLPDDQTIERDCWVVLERLGTLSIAIGNSEDAAKHLEAAANLNQSLLAKAPDSKLYKMDRAYITKQLAWLANARGEYDAALRLAVQAKDLYLQLSTSEPEDTDADVKVGASWDTIYLVNYTAGNWVGANQALGESQQRFERLAVQFPTTAKFQMLTMEAALKRTDVQTRLGLHPSALESVNRSLLYMERSEQCGDFVAGSLSDLKNNLVKISKALEFAIEHPDVDDRPDEMSEDLFYYASVFAIEQHAHAMRPKQALEIAERIADFQPVDAYVIVYGQLALIRACALCVKQLDAEDSNRALRVAISVATRLLKSNPALKEVMIKEPELSGLLRNDKFASVVQ